MKRIEPPDVDSRDTAAVARQTAVLAQLLSRWRWSPGKGADAGTALIGAFASMAQQVITRLNQMPNRHFLAYLRMLGLQPNPPRAAEVPLTFTPASGAQNVRIRAGTQVRGQHADGTRVTFYTSDALELLPGREPVLWRAVTYQPPDADGVDHAAVVTAMARGNETGYYGLFTGGHAVEHAVYLAADEILTVADATIQLSIEFSLSDDAKDWEWLQQSGNVVWEYFSGEGRWKSLSLQSPSAIEEYFQFTFLRPADMSFCALTVASMATRACWIRCRLTAWPSQSIPAWSGVTISTMKAVKPPPFAPDQILFNGVAIDTSKDYYPLGPQPKFNDCCTIVYGSLPNASDLKITVSVTVSTAADEDLDIGDAPQLTWEIGSGDVWNEAAAVFSPDGSASETSEYQTVSALKATGTATIFIGPAPDSSLRILLASGNYGQGIIVSSGVSSDDSQVVSQVVDDGYRPPILSNITVSISYTPKLTPTCVTDNGEGRRLESFAQPVIPFQLRADTKPSFYLGFGESLGQASVSMYLEIASLSDVTRSDVNNALNHDIKPKPAQVQWEYSASSVADSWQLLEVVDGTHNFAQSGFLQFIAPADHARSAQFGSIPLYWLRARLKWGGYVVPTRGGLMLPNSVAASHARTIRGELLGSSSQTPGQTFNLAHTPILDGPELVVREPALPPAEEIVQLRAEFGTMAIAPATSRFDGSDAADLGAVWVRWKQVGSFAASGPRDRHYTLDHDSGKVMFGDGDNGMAPPAGKNNVVMAGYRSGGGVAGNLPAGAICQLVTAVAHVAAVDNLVPSAGGADGEDNDAVMDWGPKVLRHRGRAVARQDYEDLVQEAFPQLAKVSAITPSFDPTNTESAQGAGHVLVVVVPDNDVERPAPSLGLLQQIAAFVRPRMPPAVQLSLSGPDWLVVDVKVRVVAKRMDRAGVLADEVARGLRHFLNPLSGGFDHTGWVLGQMVHDSDLMRYLLALPGVDSVSNLKVVRTPVGDSTDMPETEANQKLTVILVCSGCHTVKVSPPSSA